MKLYLINHYIGELLRQLRIGEGDCDSDLECQLGLICGTNNCKKEFPKNGTKWKEFDDCCTGKQ